jgi:ribonuclease G
MSKELVVSATRHETRIAILEDDSVVEIYYQREKEYSLAGSIHKGKVTRVLPGMQSAFVDIGLERDAFLYVSDFFEDNDEYDKVVTSVEEKVLKLEKGPAAELPGPSKDAESADAEGPLELADAGAGESTGEPEAVVPRPVESRAVESRPGEGRPDREPRGDGRGDPRGGDPRDRDGRRGRGRRGRRRRGGPGGPGGGIPESKFYSPRRAEAEEVGDAAVSLLRDEPRQGSGEPDDDFAVLPGESLAKYSASEPREEVEEPLVVRLEEMRVEEISDREIRVEEFRVEEFRVEQTRIDDIRLPVEPPPLPDEVWAEAVAQAKGEARIEAAAHVHVPEPEPEPASPPIPEPFAELEASEMVAAALDESETVSEEEEESDSEMAASEGSDSEEGPVEDEGPEPARIPTSLTAALREQGNRFPHRLSRRARRKLRGGAPGEHRNPPSGSTAGSTAGPTAAPAAAAADGASPAESPAAESPAAVPPGPSLVVPAPEPRQHRGRDRERSDRPERAPRAERHERGERSERSERNDRGERSERSDRGDRPDHGDRPERAASISELLREGQEIIVQIAKEPLGQKGARITSHIALPGRFLVYMPTVDHVGVSRKIPSDDERLRLKRILQTNRVGMTGGFIVRTAGEGKSEEDLRADMHFLYNLWLDIRQKAEKRTAPALLHHDLDLVQRILRDQLTSSFKTIWVDSETAFESILRFVERFQPALVNRVKLYTRSNPIFDEFNVTAELEKALRPKVWLKSGGYIVINQTEALVAIDVNTGKYVGKSNRLEDTIVRVNTDAIKEIVRQIRLRDLGGIIVVDFIDMDERKNRQKVMQALEEAMRVDRAPYKILAFNDFGLVAITRKRVKQSLERTLCSPCPSCEGAGYIKSVQTVVGEILQEAQKMAKLIEGDDVLLRVNPEVAKVLKSNRNDFLQEIEEIVGRTVMVKSDPTLHQTKFDLA